MNLFHKLLISGATAIAVSAAATPPPILTTQVPEAARTDFSQYEAAESEITSTLANRTSGGLVTFRNLPEGTQEADTPPTLSPIARFAPGTVTSRMAAPALRAAQHAAPLPVNNDKCYSADRILNTRDIATYTITFTVTGTTTKTYKVKGVYGQTSTLTLTIDPTTGERSIAAQKFITNNTTYGNIWFCPVDLASGTYSTTDPVKCTVDDRGNWTLAPWALVVNHTTDKGYNGSVLFASEGSQWLVPNMTLEYETTDAQGAVKQNSYPGAWFQDDVSGLYLLNMGNTTTGRAVNVRLTPQKTGVLSPQFVSSAGGYGSLYAYHADYATGQAASAKSATCTVTDDNRLVFDDLIIATRKIASSSNIRLAASPITYVLTGDDVKFPDPIDIGFQGSGTAADPYRLTSAADIRALSAAMSVSGYATAHYKVMNDIDLSGLKDFTPAGDDNVPFNGTLDGNGKTLSGLTYNGFGFTYTGLFGVTGPRATIKNLTLDRFSIYATGANSGILTAYNAGGTISGVTVTGSLLSTQSEVAGGIAGMSTGKISGCRVNAVIKGYGASGGIVGYNCSEIADCHFHGEMAMSGALSTSYRHIGGIAAQTLSAASNGFKTYIHDCTVSGTISDDYGYAYVGGIAAVAHGSKTEDPAVIERCVNMATISCVGLDYASDSTLPKSYAGGIAGYISATTIDDCANGGLILETSRPKVFTGGVVGIASVSFISSGTQNYLGNVSSVKRCLQLGQIYITDKVETGVYGAVPVLDRYDSDEVAAQIFKDCHADNQINLLSTDTYGMSTAALTSGTLPAGFDAATWTATAGSYPLPTSLKSTDAAILLAAPAVLASGENYTNVKKNFTLGGATSVKWGILGANGNVSDQSASLAISGTSATIGNDYGNDWLVAQNGRLVKMLHVSIVPGIFDGEGTAESPFLIKTIDDMAALNRAVVTFGQSHRGDFFRMSGDITRPDDSDFVCVGYPAMVAPFNGTFDGDGHSFHNLAVKTAFRTASGGVTATKSYQYGGLFSFIGEAGTVKNVVIADDCEYDVYNMSGAIAGMNLGTVASCRNYARIGANGMASGGIVGENGGTVSGCYNAATVEVQQSAIKTGAGGIAGANTGTIDLCQNDGDITITKGKTVEVSGGIAAINYGKISRSVNLGSVTANVKAAGIVATLGAYGQTGELSQCLSLGIATTVKDASNGAVANDVRDYKVSDVIYDSSITAVGASLNPLAGCTGMSTAELTSGDALSGFDSEVFDVRAGMYPVLKTFVDETRTSLLRSTYAGFTTGQSIANVGTDIALASPQSVTWAVTESASFALDGSTVKVTVPSGEMSAKATLTASDGKGVVKTWPLTSLPVLFAGKGTADEPYIINDKDDLTKLANFISNNAYDCLNTHYRLGADITYADGDEFVPVGGDGTTKFNGRFDGDGHTVAGIVYASTTAKPGKNTGLFGQVGPQGVIHGVTVNSSFTGYGAGAVAAQLEGEIYDCTNSGTVIATGDPAGGIVGTLKTGGLVHDCTNTGTVISEKTYGTGGIIGKMEKETSVADCVNKGQLGSEKQGTSLGGITGVGGGTITGCHNEGQLMSASASVGGIVGKHLAGALLEIADCHNSADINVPQSTGVGGIIGGNNADKTLNKAQVHLTRCHNTGNIVATLGVGGVAGIVSESDFTVSECYNTGNIEALNLGAKGFADTFAGGLIGCANGSTVEGTPQYISQCYNTGNVTAWGGNNIGGLTGKNGAPIDMCYNTGTVTALFDAEGLTDLTGFSLSSIGGLTGSAYGSVSNSWNSGAVTTDGCWVGGIAGYTNRDITGCANIADIAGRAGAIAGGSDTQAVAGIVGRMGSISSPGMIASCYNTGKITGLTQVAGIVAQRFGTESQITDTYNTGIVEATAAEGTAFAIGNPRSVDDLAIPADANVYYLDGCCPPASTLDNSAKPLSRDELAKARLGEDYIHAAGSLPVLASLYRQAPVYFDAVYGVGFENTDDTADGVTGLIYFACLDGLSWTSSDNLALDTTDGIATSTSDGAAWLRVSTTDNPDVSKTFDLDIKIVAGIGDITSGDEAVVSEYFDLTGRRVATPARGNVYIVRTTGADGVSSTSKILFR